eukprot:s2458_g4.t2
MFRHALRRGAKAAEEKARAATRQLVLFSRAGQWTEAVDYLARLPVKNVVHRNAAISACSKASAWPAALALLEHDRATFKPDPVAVASAFGAKGLPWPWVLRLLGDLRTWRVPADDFVGSAAVSCCSRNAQWEMALDLLFSLQMQQSVVAVGAAIAGAARASAWEAALALLSLRSAGVRPSFIALSTTVLACSDASKWEAVLAVLQDRPLLDAVTCTAAVTACRDGSSWKHALGLLSDAWAARKRPDQEGSAFPLPSLTSANACLSALERASSWQLASSLLFDFPQNDLQPDEVSFNTVISACVGRLKWQHALALFELMKLKSLHRDAVSWSSCITACTQGQSAEAALQLYDEYSKEATQLNTVVVNAAMAACGASRTWQRAVALTHQLQYTWQALSEAPDEVSFNTTIAVCAAGQAWEMALHFFRAMADLQCNVGAAAIGAVLGACSHGRWKEAQKIAADSFSGLEGLPPTMERALQKAYLSAGLSCGQNEGFRTLRCYEAILADAMPPTAADQLELCLRKESGEIWQRRTFRTELKHLGCVADLKRFLASLDPRSPPPQLVALEQLCKQDGLVELEDDEDIPWSSLFFPVGSVDVEGVGVPSLLHYSLKEVDMLGFLKSKGWWMTLPDEAWPKAGGVQNVFKMFEPCVSVLLAHIRTSLGMAVYQEFMLLWRYLILHLPGHVVDAVREDGSTLLSAMLQFLHDADPDGLDAIVLAFIEQKTLKPEVLNRNAVDRKRQLSIPVLWYCSSLNPTVASQSSSRRSHAEVALALLERYKVCPSMWDVTLFGGCSFLQHLLQVPPLKDAAASKPRSEALLCMALAERFSLQQFCHQNHRGLCALTYAEQLVQEVGSKDDGIWRQVVESIKRHMIARAHEHQGQMTELVVLLHQLQDALDVSQADPAGTWPCAELRQVVDAVEGVVFRLAVDIRKGWMKTGRGLKVGRYHRHVLDRRRSSY